ncbi:hypothetical protein ID866_9114 [Astraeus odoratus]|nr:hypothetical protein ID866_9114 [Astraeus odoratus]
MWRPALPQGSEVGVPLVNGLEEPLTPASEGKRTNLCSLERELARPGDARNLDNTEGISSHSKGLSTNSSDDLSCRTSVEQTVDPSGQLSHLAHSLSCRGVKLLGKFDLDQTVVSYGGDAIVYQGKLLTQGKVAVKVVHFHKNDLSGLKKLLNEIYIWSKLHHENILPLLGVTIEFGDSIAMVSQWMAGGNAHMYVQDQTIDPRTLVSKTFVAFVHATNYLSFSSCHGDLKGHNVLISDDGHALLGDFGHSCSYFADLSMSDMVCEPRCGGTLRWMPPERLGYPNRNATTEGDVWAFGMTALELFTRKVPFSETKGESRLVTRILMRRLPDRPSSEATLTRLSDEWWNVCTGCWAEDPSKRLQMSEVIKLLSVGA